MAKAEWLVMLYMSADSDDLARPLEDDLRELGGPLAGAKLDENLVVVALIESSAGYVRRERIGSAGRTLLDAHSPVGDYALYRFVRRTAEQFPAERRLLVLWGHSAGIGEAVEPVPPQVQLLRVAAVAGGDGRIAAIRPPVPSAHTQRAGQPGPARRAAAVALDPLEGLATPPHATPFTEPPQQPPVRAKSKKLRLAAGAGLVARQAAPVPAAVTPSFEAWPRLDVIGFDTCYVSSIELAAFVRAQLGPRCQYLLAPQSSISLNGWRYDWLAQQLVAKPASSPEELTQGIVNHVGRARSAPRMLTALDLEQVNAGAERDTDLVALMSAWVRVIEGQLNDPRRRPAVLNAFLSTRWAGVRQFLDLGDLCRRLGQLPEATLRSTSRALVAWLTRDPGGIVVDHAASTAELLGGVSIYCPWVRASLSERRQGAYDVELPDERYEKLALPGQTGWLKLMKHPQAAALARNRHIAQGLRDAVDSVFERLDGHGRRARRRTRDREAKWGDREAKWGDREAKWGDRVQRPEVA